MMPWLGLGLLALLAGWLWGITARQRRLAALKRGIVEEEWHRQAVARLGQVLAERPEREEAEAGHEH